MPALLVVNHHQAARIALRLLVRPWPASGRQVISEATSPAMLEAAFTRLREHLETKNVTIQSVKDVARESLRRAKAQIEID